MTDKFPAEEFIDVTGADLVELVKAAYRHSVPQGMGFLHAKPGELSDEDANSIIEDGNGHAIHMDYVHGRCCKFNVFAEGDRVFIRNQWYDHTQLDLERLLADAKVGVRK